MNKMVLIIGVIVIMIVGFCVYYFGNKQKMTRVLNELPETSIKNLRINEVYKTSGNVLILDKPLIAPLSGKECVYYMLKVEQKTKSGKNDNWNVIGKDEQIQDFFIAQNEDKVLIKPQLKPKEFESYVTINLKEKVNISGNNSDRIESLIEKFNIKKTAFMGFSNQLRFSEVIIGVEEHVTVVGVVKSINLKEPIQDYSYSKIIALEHDDKQKLIITNIPK